ncbi:hypothetical protein [Vibrio sp. WXL103]|uniref:hypothetical protein n=1 Tax=Vibrio sp. WXL103 TaxID=3450710 RepID=UPI003EC684C4
MATDFILTAEKIVREIYVRANIDRHEGQSHLTDDEGGSGIYKLTLSIEELKQIAGLQRMRKTYSNGKGGFFKRLIEEINKGWDNEFYSIYATEVDEAIVVVHIPRAPYVNDFTWEKIRKKNTDDILAQRDLILNGDEEAPDYRYMDWDWNKSNGKLCEWSDYEQFRYTAFSV